MHLRMEDKELTPQLTKPDVSTGSRKRTEVPQHVLDLFWSLAVTDENERVNSSAELISFISKDGESDSEELPSSLKYTVKRLVTGLSSSRQAAPLGFATAFCEVLRCFASRLNLEDLLQTISECLQTSKQDSRGHQTHANLGKVLAYTGVIRSGLISKATGKDLQTIAKAVAKIRSKFTVLAAATTECIVQLCNAVDVDALRPVIVEHLNEELTGGWQQCSPDTLQLLLVLKERGVLSSEYLVEHWETAKLVSSKTLRHLSRVMIQSTLHHPVIHQVNMTLVERAAAVGVKLLTKLYKDVIIGEVYNADKPARCYMVYHIIPETLKRFNKPQLVSAILCPELIGRLMKQMTHREAYLHKAAVKLVADVVDVVKSSTDGQFQLEVLQCLLSEPGSFMFDSMTSSRTVSNIISHLSKDGALKFLRQLMSVISSDKLLYGKRGEGVVPWCSVTLVHMLTLSSVTHAGTDDCSWHTDILKFLMLHACFVVKAPAPQLKHCKRVGILADGDRAPVKESLLKGLSVMSTYQHVQKGAAGKSMAVDYTAVLHELFEYTSQLVNAKKQITPFRSVTNEELTVWSDLGKTCEQVHKCKQESADEKSKTAMYDAFQLMLELFGLHMFIVESSERAEVIDTIKEIQTCFTKAVSRTRSKKEEPEWCEVITEVLISLMSKSSLLLRSVSTSVFHKILPMCNVASIQLILDVFSSEDDEFDADNEEDEMEDEDTSSLVGNGDNQTKEDEDDSSSMSSSDDSDVSDEEEDGEVDEKMRATVRAALGSAAVTQSDQEDDDLSDSEMFKLDDALSEAFRSMRRKNKNSPEELEKKRQIKHFKLRCLDMIDVVVKHSSKGEHLLEVVVPLLTLIEAGYKDKEMKELGKKTQTIYSHLISHKKLPSCTITDRDDVTEKVKEILTLSTNAYVWPIMKEIYGSLNLMIKLLSHVEYISDKKSKKVAKKEQAVAMEDGRAPLVKLVHSALNEFLTKRESRYSHTLFQGLFERQPVLFWQCSRDLLQSIVNADIRIFYRTQACALMLQLLHKTIRTEIAEASWQEFKESLVKSIKPIAEYSVESYKPGFLQEYFSVLQRTQVLDKTVAIDATLFEPVTGKFNKDLTKLFRRISLTGSSKQTKDSTKKKRPSHEPNAVRTRSKKSKVLKPSA